MISGYSPLRYPGGKEILAAFLSDVIKENNIKCPVYAEPFAGGCGAALRLLINNKVEEIIINDADFCIYAFWKSILEKKNNFLDLLDKTPVTVDEWRRQHLIYSNPKKHSLLKVGFATFYLNRCNRSGILINSGIIGGYDQKGAWKIDARFNKESLANKIEKISVFKKAIKVSNLDAIVFLKEQISNHRYVKNLLVYLDPPYYLKGSKLYLNYYSHKDHYNLAAYLKSKKRFKWIMTYDNVLEISKLYSQHHLVSFYLNYSVHTARKGGELLIYPLTTRVPHEMRLSRAA